MRQTPDKTLQPTDRPKSPAGLIRKTSSVKLLPFALTGQVGTVDSDYRHRIEETHPRVPFISPHKY